ncbi:hypothetical protein [Streptomyces sp. AC495_CC817]|uniref:hypothetical protein n=1 Tax=Streptomyces sp. AC495_CC817 TaxID=2823900 RepID=UPI001C265D5A|nr:hypothetical protein [Streptomyces sp. AC495_CC817]
MTRRHRGSRRILAVMLAGALLGGSLAGCATESPKTDQTEETAVDYGNVADAVTTAVPRVVNVRDLQRSSNGFGHRLSLGLEADSAEPFTADELDAVVEAVWGSLPWEPNTIKITAGAETDQGREAVDLRAAADQLEPLGVTNAGTGGVSLTDMSARYGAWAAPE